jgi:GNAT superfamily N-acetyltransferase
MMAAEEKKEAGGRIRLLEEISINAWPAFETSLCDGWIVRFADGFSRRSNSILPLYPSRMGIREKIHACESMYRGRGLRTVFKMTAASQPSELDSILAADGYRLEAETGVRTMPLDDWNAPPTPDAVLREDLAEEWLQALCAMNGYDPRHHAVVAKLTSLIHPPRAFAAVRREGRIAACGLGVVRNGFVCCFDIVVEEGHRRLGLGRQIMMSLLHWGKENSTAAAFLQVMTNNPIAEAMYAGFGFREEYRYVYRVKD